MLEEVKELVVERRKEGMNALKERERYRQNKPQSCQAGAELELTFTGDNSHAINALAELEVYMLPA